MERERNALSKDIVNVLNVCLVDFTLGMNATELRTLKSHSFLLLLNSNTFFQAVPVYCLAG